MGGAGFEWLVAWRHLRDPERRSRKTLAAGLVVLALGGLALLTPWLVPKLVHVPMRAPAEWREVDPMAWLDYAKTGGIIAIIAGLLLTLLGVLFATFTVFAAVSIYGVFLGTGAPIIALSVMSGFENDLKTKIRSTKADVVVNRADDKPFTDWEAITKQIEGLPGIVGAMPYVEAEVIVKHATNPAGMGIILRGIDPARAGQVLGLERTLREGKISHLARPELIPGDDAELVEPSDVARRGEHAVIGKGSKTGEGAPEVRPEVRPGDPAENRAEDRAEDRPPDRLRLPGILLGEELYQHVLRVFVGSVVDVACPQCGIGPAGPMPKLKPFRVAGHFYSGMYEFDSKLAYISVEAAQRFLDMPGEVTGIEVRTETPERAREVADDLGPRLGPAYEVRSWEELNRGLFAALKLEKVAMFVVLTFIALVASFSIVSNLIMLVTEKAREVAILKSMGARDGAILRVFFAEGLYIGILGLFFGLALGIGGCLLLKTYGLPLDPDVYYIQRLPVVMRGFEIAGVSLAALALCCLATLYPAFLAARMRPVDGLRYE